MAVFFILNLTKAYFQKPVAEEDFPKSTVNTLFGLFQFRRVPFRLRNTAQIFQRLTDNVLRGLFRIYAYVDNVLIENPDDTQHKTPAQSSTKTSASRLENKRRQVHISSQAIADFRTLN